MWDLRLRRISQLEDPPKMLDDDWVAYYHKQGEV